MSQYKNDVPDDQGRNDMEPLSNNFFWKWLVSMGAVAAEGGVGMFGVNLQSAMPQALPGSSGSNTNIPTNPVEKLMKGLQSWLKKWGSSRPGVKNGAPRALRTDSTPRTNIPTNPVEK
jgi:hypothetical protein